MFLLEEGFQVYPADTREGNSDQILQMSARIHHCRHPLIYIRVTSSTLEEDVGLF